MERARDLLLDEHLKIGMEKLAGHKIEICKTIANIMYLQNYCKSSSIDDNRESATRMTAYEKLTSAISCHFM